MSPLHLHLAGIKFVKKIGGPSRRGGGNKQLASDARPLGPWNLKALESKLGQRLHLIVAGEKSPRQCCCCAAFSKDKLWEHCLLLSAGKPQRSEEMYPIYPHQRSAALPISHQSAAQA